MDDESSSRPPPTYDSFVLRLWRVGAAGPVRRIQVEHVQSGARIEAAELDDPSLAPLARLLRRSLCEDERVSERGDSNR
jgi:hypothetical protein